MKTKETHLLVAASMMAVAGWAAWRFAAIPDVVEPPANTSLPAQQTTPVAQPTTPATSPRTGRPIVSQAIETPEMLKARLTEQTRRIEANIAAQKADPKAFMKAQKDLRKHEDMAFLNTLGLSDELREKVYQMLRAKGDLYSDHKEQMSEAHGRGEVYTALGREFRQMNTDLEAAVGTENYRKIRYWEATLLERMQTGKFQGYLQDRRMSLTEQQEGAVVDAMYQARNGRAGFSLMVSHISMQDKLAYIGTVKQNLAPVLNANQVALLEQHLKEIVEAPSKIQAFEESLQKQRTEILKRAEEMKKKNPSKSPAAPR